MSDELLKGKKILLGVSSSIASYKAVDLASKFVNTGAEVQVIITPSTKRFVEPLAFEAITGRLVYHNIFDTPRSMDMEHIEYARWGDVYVIAPATATTLARLANGLANEPVSVTYLSYQGQTFVAPAMNTAMWNHVATQRNMSTLRDMGVRAIMPDAGRLACGEVGVGRLAEPERIVARIVKYFENPDETSSTDEFDE